MRVGPAPLTFVSLKSLGDTGTRLMKSRMSEISPKPPSWSDHKKRFKSPLLRYTVAIEWATEWIVYWLKRWALVDLLTVAGSFALLGTLISYCQGAEDRARAHEDTRKARQSQAWQVITSAQGKPGNGGRTQALKDLASDSVDLSGVDVSGAWLVGLTVPGASLRNLKADSANLNAADLRGVDLSEANLSYSSLSGADLRGAMLNGAVLTGTMLDETCMDGANLRDVKADNAVFDEASMRGVDASGAHFRGSWFYGTVLDSVNFENAVLDSAHLDSIPNSARIFYASIINPHWFRSEWLRSTQATSVMHTLRTRGAIVEPNQQSVEYPGPNPLHRNRLRNRSLQYLDSIYPRKRVNDGSACKPQRR